jgi:CHAT domain-containing protein
MMALVSRMKAIVVAAALLGATPAFADAPHGDFPLGQTDSGAICMAVVSPDDTAAQLRDAHAWEIHCRGFDGVFGHIYAYGMGGTAAIAPNGPWRKALAAREDCASPAPAGIAGLDGAEVAICKPQHGGVQYRAYSVANGDQAAAAEGFAPISPLVELGLKIAMGVAPVPQSDLQTQAGSGGAGAELNKLLEAASAAQESGDYLNSRAQLENKGWEFADAERDFRELEQSTNLSERDLVLAEFNLALNVSDEGPAKFDEANKLFAAANKKAESLHDPEVDALSFNYLALHYLNQRHFADAIKAAEKAIALRRTIDPNLEHGGSAATATVDPTDQSIVVSSALAADLNTNTRTMGLRVFTLTPVERLEIQNAQAQYVIGAARSRLGDQSGARNALESANTTLSSGRLASARSTGWLHAEVYLILGNIELRNGNASQAASDFRSAIAICDRVSSLSATPFEGDLYLNYARAEAKSGDGDKALEDYKRGIELFSSGKRDVSEARNLTGPYFDLLLERIRSNAADAADFRERYFDTMQVLAGQGTAKVFAEFAAGASKGDARSEQLAREVRDTNYQIQRKQEAVSRAQDSGNYSSEQKAADDAALKSLAADAQALQEQLLDANPKYGQVIEATASLADMQKALQPGEIYVKTVLLAERGYGIAITHDKIVTYPVALTKTEAEAKVKELRLPFDRLGLGLHFDPVKSHAFFVKLFGPVTADVTSAQHLIYDPDSGAVSLPAALLVTDQASVDKFNAAVAYAKEGHPRTDIYKDVAWLGRNTDISLAISSEVFLQSRAIAPSKGQRGFVGFGDPVTLGNDPRRYSLLVEQRSGANYDYCEAVREKAEQVLRPLPEIRPAIISIAQKYDAGPNDLVLGQAFTDDAVLARQDLNTYRVVFFGTHGELPSKMPCLPRPTLITSLGSASSSDAFLDAAKIVKLTMDADLVVLAACDTGSATAPTGETPLSESGDAFDSFVRDFIFAGARNLVVSQWEVSAGRTATLMEKLFDANNSGQADALRQAQLALMNDPEYSNPYYWAGFTLVGDGARPMPHR